AWIATIDLDSENMKGLGPREIEEFLSRKTYEGGFSKLVHHEMHKRIRIAQHQIVEGTGDNPLMRATVNMIEVPIHGWTPEDLDEWTTPPNSPRSGMPVGVPCGHPGCARSRSCRVARGSTNSTRTTPSQDLGSRLRGS